MKNLKKYHATEKVSYRKGVLYEVERVADVDDIRIKNNGNSLFGLFKYVSDCVNKITAHIGRLNVKNGKKRIKRTKSAGVNKYTKLRKDDKRFYLITSLAAVGTVMICATVTALAMVNSTVTINDEGRITYASIGRGQTVAELLKENNITLGSGDAVEVSDEQKLTNGMQIMIHRAMPVTLYVNGEKQSVDILAGTVQDALDKAKITLGEYDEVYPELSANITSGMTINIIRVEVKQVTERSVIEYKEIRRQSGDYPKGEEYLAQEGKDGTLEQVVNVVYKNGVEFKREVESSKVIVPAKDEIVYVGTYVAPENNSSSSSGSTSGQNIPAVEGLLTKLPTLSQIHSGTLSQHKSIAPPASQLIAKVVTCETTAYTWTGNKTATGVYPRIGTLAVDPELIPYGTLVYIPGYGYGRAEDTGGFKNSAGGYWIDLYMDSYQECINWGRRNVKIYILKG